MSPKSPPRVPIKDAVFQSPERATQPFRFDEEVAAAFDDMARRSIPGYLESLRTVRWLAEEVVGPKFVDGRLYDLGASTGALEQALTPLLLRNDWRVVAVDLAAPMLEQAQARLDGSGVEHRIEWRCEDIADTRFDDAVMVVSNYCLQFVAPPQRGAILQRIYDALRPGAFLVLSEKTRDSDAQEALFQSRYDAFKRDNGYSEAEIAGKRAALQGVLQPWSFEENEAALRAVGFTKIYPIAKHWNFCTWLVER